MHEPVGLCVYLIYREFLLPLHELLLRVSRGSRGVLRLYVNHHRHKDERGFETWISVLAARLMQKERKKERKKKSDPFELVFGEDLLGASLPWRVGGVVVA